MDIPFLIRSAIFLVAGLIVILLPGKVYSFQSYVFDRINVKYDKKRMFKSYPRMGAIFIAISAAIFVYAIII